MATHRFTYAHPIFNRKSLVAQSSKYSKLGGIWWEDSIYYLWFRALQLSEAYYQLTIDKGHVNKKKNAVYKDFGPIAKYTFEYWWNDRIKKHECNRGEYLFGAKTSMHVYKTDKAINDNENITLTIPLHLSKRAIASEIKHIVKKVHVAKRGDNLNKVLKAKYTPKTNRGRTTALKKVLLFREMQSKYTKDTLVQTWEKCIKKNRAFGSGDSYSTVESINATASRLKKRYKEIEQQVLLGAF